MLIFMFSVPLEQIKIRCAGESTFLTSSNLCVRENLLNHLLSILNIQVVVLLSASVIILTKLIINLKQKCITLLICNSYPLLIQEKFIQD